MKLNISVYVTFIIIAALQAVLGDSLSVWSIKPSLMLVAVYAFSITEDGPSGIIYGAFAGFLDDCLSGGYIGLFISGYALVGYLAGRAGKKWFNIGESANFAGILVLSLINGIYTAALVETVRGGNEIIYMSLRYALPQAFYNALAGALLLWLFRSSLSRRVPWLKTIRQLQVRI
jgi:rod shape-determining protein MreD